jgi:tRNA threonylcarbamoyl adenosine modification protein (Sua5/YciO/YrdC/YwlC family)
MLLKIREDNPNPRDIAKAVEVLRKGGVIIYPTDTVYGLGCDINCARAVERVARIKGIKVEKSNFSIICNDLGHITDFTKPLNNNTFKLMRRLLPGPYTFILPASSNVPKIFKSKKKTVGIRVPASNICRELAKGLGSPIMTTSIKDQDEFLEYTTDPGLIYEDYQKLVDAVIDGGAGQNVPSTVIDCTGDEFVVLRQGIGLVDF